MICYAIGAYFDTSTNNKKSITWHTSRALNLKQTFFQNYLSSWTQEIFDFCINMDVGFCDCIQKNHYFFYAAKLADSFFVIACDTQLTSLQIKWLHYHIIIKKIPFAEIATNLEKYCDNYQLHEIEKELSETKKIMQDNIEQTLARGKKIEDIMQQTKNFPAITFRFKKSTEEFNKCKPSCNLL
ncbi:MAG TPA: R-SNARE family protein [Legionella sp.]|nr:R-SNARE family protein [Legionella sp.]